MEACESIKVLHMFILSFALLHHLKTPVTLCTVLKYHNKWTDMDRYGPQSYYIEVVRMVKSLSPVLIPG